MDNRIKKFSIDGPEPYNMVFDPRDGLLMRWGKTLDDDPSMCPIGPEIADIEISTVCNGIGKSMDTRQPCSWCYKSNTGEGENMSLATFQSILARFPPTLTQIAFGIGDIEGNPDLWAIMQHCRDKGVVPNLTTNGMGVDARVANRLAKLCGAVAVSHYGIDDVCFNAVDQLVEQGLKQVNLHKLLSAQSYDSCFRLIDRVSRASPDHDPRLGGVKAIVFLLLKPKGDRNRLSPLTDMSKYRALLDYAQRMGVSVGMDSCSAPMALQTLPGECVQSVEPCESGLFSIYLNVKGEVFPCSFTEGTPGWETGIDMAGVSDFTSDVWYHPRIATWRQGLLGSSGGCGSCEKQVHCRSCPIYDITICNPKPELGGDQLVQIGGLR